MAELLVDPDTMTARVKPRVNPKYARKLVQDWLKAYTPWKGGWVVSIENLYDHGSNYYNMSISNPFKHTVEVAVKVADDIMPKHFDRTHFTATTIGGRVFLYCPVGNICSWSQGDVEHKWCEWCKKSFGEITR